MKKNFFGRDKAPPSAAQYHDKAFKEHPEFKEMALFATNAWGQGFGTAQSCMLLAMKAVWTVSDGSDLQPPTFDQFKIEFNALLGAEVKEPKPVVEDDDEDEEEDTQPEEADEEPFAVRMARLAAEAKAKPKKRQRRAA